MTQVFQNLIGNSIKYRSKERPDVHVSARQKNNKCIFSVRDNGIGIDPKHSDSVFEIFKRLHGRHEFKGTGIGLAIYKKIAEIHGGHIYFESEHGNGATFYFELPVKI